MKFLEKLIHRKFSASYRAKWYKIKLGSKIIYGKTRRQFLRPPYPQLEKGTINLHLGCGSINHPKFINIDGLSAPHIHYVRPIDDLSIFKDNSVDLIYACHCLEHFLYAEVPKVLAEWFRVLKSGGILRLSVPNFDLLLDVYRENGNDLNTIILPLMGGQDYKFNFHMAVFNRANLESFLKNAGFKQAQEWQPGSCELTTFNDWSARKALINGKYYSINLNIEAIK
jgi:predicted SAM-dependent methyltransferase